MANKFVIKKGFKSKGDSQITGSLNISNTITALVISGSTISGSLIGDGSNITGTGGETNTASNTGSGDGLFVEKVSSDLRFKTLLSGSSELTITTSSYEVTVNRQSIVLNETNLYFNNDTTDTTITIGTNSGSNFTALYPVNTLEAIADGSSNVRVQLKGGAVVVANSLVTSSIYINNSLVTTSSLATVTSSLNDLFANAIGQVAPTITSNTSISLVTGSSVNYTLTGTDIVAYRWYNLPTGLVPKTGDTKTLLGGSSLVAGSYGFTASAANYYGEATANITLTVDSELTNTYSWVGSASSYFDTGATAAQNNNSPFYMASGDSSGSAWTIFYWVKHLSTDSTGTYRNILAFGNAHATVVGSPTEGVFFNSRAWGSPHNFQRATVTIGLYPNNVYLSSPGITRDVWHSVMFTYDGTDINNSSAAPFKVVIDGVDVTASGLPGYSGTGHGDGIFCTGAGLPNTHELGHAPLINHVKISELVTFSGNLISNSSSFHNGGDGGFDFAPYNPKQWYRMGDGYPFTDISTYPLMANRGSVANVDMTLTSGTIDEYVSDVPS